MSRRGNCVDNAPIESFLGTLKGELVYHRRLATRVEARRATSEYIEMFYNRQHAEVHLERIAPCLPPGTRESVGRAECRELLARAGSSEQSTKAWTVSLWKHDD
jgi:hypothetical protein